MAQVRITTSDLRNAASSMLSISSNMNSIASSMESRVKNIESWTDARAEQFKQQASVTAQQLRMHIENFTNMAKFLQKYAQQQEEAERQMKARMSNLN